jgi:hypothetical protein
LLGAQDCNRVWGSTSGNEGQGSRVSVRFVGSVSTKHTHPKATLLPHKQSGPRHALATGESFTLRLTRLVGCTADDWDHAQRAVKLWLLLGCLGLRANRAAGSVWPEMWAGNPTVPQTAEALKNTLQTLGLRNWSVATVGLGAGKSEVELRETASDTLDGTSDVFGGIKPQRKPSPTKFKVARLATNPGHRLQACLLAVAPSEQVTVNGSRQFILQHAEKLLKPKTRWQALGNWNYILP